MDQIEGSSQNQEPRQDNDGEPKSQKVEDYKDQEHVARTNDNSVAKSYTDVTEEVAQKRQMKEAATKNSVLTQLQINQEGQGGDFLNIQENKDDIPQIQGSIVSADLVPNLMPAASPYKDSTYAGEVQRKQAVQTSHRRHDATSSLQMLQIEENKVNGEDSVSQQIQSHMPSSSLIPITEDSQIMQQNEGPSLSLAQQISNQETLLGRQTEGLKPLLPPSDHTLKGKNMLIQQKIQPNIANSRANNKVLPFVKSAQTKNTKEDVSPQDQSQLLKAMKYNTQQGTNNERCEISPMAQILREQHQAENRAKQININEMIQKKEPEETEIKIETIWEKIILQSQTWDRECHGLYDFDLTNVKKIETQFVGCGYVQRKKQQIRIELPGLAAEQAQDSKDEEETENLLGIVYKHNSYWLFHNHSIDAESYKHHIKMAWYIVRYNQDKLQPSEYNKFYIEQGDIIKFGRVRFRVRKLKIEDDKDSSDEKDENGSKTIFSHPNTIANQGNEVGDTNVEMVAGRVANGQQQPSGVSERSMMNTTMLTDNLSMGNDNENANFNRFRFDADLKINAAAGGNFNTIDNDKRQAKILDEEPICRICLSEDEPGNPIIAPCKCIGSVKYIHLNCIQEWLEGKKHKKETDFVNSYIWRGLECEICKTFYNDLIIDPKTGEEVSLLKYDIHPEAEHYGIIESVTNSSSKTIHVINFSASQDIKVGRGSQCEVRITDVSVSRHHSTLELMHYSNGKGKITPYLRVMDENSKFGTLVFMRKPIPLSANKKLTIQVGRTILTVQSQDRLNLCQKFFCQYSNLKKDESNAIVHYDEASKYFPKEFEILFSNNQSKGNKKGPKTQVNKNLESLNFIQETQQSPDHRDSIDNQNVLSEHNSQSRDPSRSVIRDYETNNQLPQQNLYDSQSNLIRVQNQGDPIVPQNKFRTISHDEEEEEEKQPDISRQQLNLPQGVEFRLQTIPTPMAQASLPEINQAPSLNNLNNLRSQERITRMQTRLPNLELGAPPINEFQSIDVEGLLTNQQLVDGPVSAREEPYQSSPRARDEELGFRTIITNDERQTIVQNDVIDREQPPAINDGLDSPVQPPAQRSIESPRGEEAPEINAQIFQQDQMQTIIPE